MSTKAVIEKREDYRAMQARLTYLREDLHECHWISKPLTARNSTAKYVPIRTAGGIHFLRSITRART
jgi:hypothetical protein